MASRFARLNGWQRLWFVGSICLGLWLIVWWPLVNAGQQTPATWEYRRAIEKDFANPACRDYQERPISELREPDSSLMPCWHIYLGRQYDDTVPYTLAAYDHKRHTDWRDSYLMALGIGTAGTVMLSALIYFVGWVIAWILRGFRGTTS